MVGEDSVGRRRSRRRATAQQGPPSVTVPEVAEPEPVVSEPVAAPSRTERAAKPRHVSRGESRSGPAAARGARGDRDLAGSGSSQVGPTGAMRARDLNRPTPEDLAEAEAELDIVRRHWAPTADAPGAHPERRRRS